MAGVPLVVRVPQFENPDIDRSSGTLDFHFSPLVIVHHDSSAGKVTGCCINCLIADTGWNISPHPEQKCDVTILPEVCD
jgi:hypothetical protein